MHEVQGSAAPAAVVGEGARPMAGLGALVALCAIARFHRIAADPATLAHQLGCSPGEDVDTDLLLRAAKQLGLKAKLSRTTLDRLSLTPLPALALLRGEEGQTRCVILAQCDGQRVLLQDPSAASAPPGHRAARSLRSAMDRRTDPHHQPREPRRRARQVRLLLVHPQPRQVPAAAGRSAG